MECFWEVMVVKLAYAEDCWVETVTSLTALSWWLLLASDNVLIYNGAWFLVELESDNSES